VAAYAAARVNTRRSRSVPRRSREPDGARRPSDVHGPAVRGAPRTAATGQRARSGG